MTDRVAYRVGDLENEIAELRAKIGTLEAEQKTMQQQLDRISGLLSDHLNKSRKIGPSPAITNLPGGRRLP